MLNEVKSRKAGKKIIPFLFLFIALNAVAQTDAAEDTSAQPAISAVGKPDGKLKEITIGKEGGSISSSDGKAVLIIPAGAVSKKTNFSIQPITNLMPNGNGAAYRLEPSGIQFQKPVQLIFNYDEDEAKDTMQLLMGIAMQDDKGQWFGLKKFTVDTVAKTLSGDINHFSDWSKFDAIKIRPDQKRLKVKKTLYLYIEGVTPSPEQGNDDELVPLTRIPKKAVWRVNNILKGNTTVGTLILDVATDAESINMYRAPAEVPNQNPVAVSVKLEGLSIKFNGINFNNLRLVSNILIYDNAYEVKMITSINGTAGTELGKVTYKDTGSFVVSVKGKDTKIIEKVNKNTPDKLDYEGKCEIKQLKPGSGNIHIIGAKSIKVIPPSTPDGNAWIEIEFIQAPTIFPLLQFRCPPVGKGEWTTDNNKVGNAMMVMMPAFPQHIKFEAKEEEQTVLLIGKEGREMYVKYTVKQIKEEE
jgi:hypothetical protein